jgi:hypothetical protein
VDRDHKVNGKISDTIYVACLKHRPFLCFYKFMLLQKVFESSIWSLAVQLTEPRVEYFFTMIWPETCGDKKDLQLVAKKPG